MGGIGRLEEGNTSMDMMYIHKFTNANHSGEVGRERFKVGWEVGEGSTSTVCMYASITLNFITMYDYNASIKKGEVVTHVCGPSTWEAETGGYGFAANLSYLVRPSAT